MIPKSKSTSYIIHPCQAYPLHFRLCVEYGTLGLAGILPRYQDLQTTTVLNIRTYMRVAVVDEHAFERCSP